MHAPVSVASSSPTLLVVVRQALRDRVVDDVLHVRLVDTHAERDSGTNDFDVTR